MSKKIISKVIACIILITMCVATFSACTFIKQNEYRVANQTIATIKGANGITLTVSQNELLEYYSSYAYYLVNYYGYTAEKAYDWAVENKIKSKYLTTVAMGYLSSTGDKKDKRTANLLTGKGAMANPVDVLTPAERYAAIQTVNASIQTTIDDIIAKAHQDELEAIVDDLSNINIKRIEFLPSYKDGETDVIGTVDSEDGKIKGYLRKDFYVNQDIDADSIKFRVVYEDENGTETYSDACVVPTTMYEKAYASKEAAKDSELIIKFEEKVVDGKEVTYETHKATFKYNVVAPRATKTKPAEVVNLDEIKIKDEIKVDRYATEEAIAAAGGKIELIDPEAKYEALKKDNKADGAVKDAYRQLIQNLKKNNKTMAQLYDAAYESAVLSALSSEVKKGATDATDAEILAEYKYLYATGKNGYTDDTKANDTAFATAIKGGMDTMYYRPATTDLSDYYYVSQILFKFSDKQAAFVKDSISDNDELNERFYEKMKTEIKTKESNPKYDADYNCKKHEKHMPNEKCKYAEEGKDEANCPSIAYREDEQKFTDVYAKLQAALIAAKTSEEKVAVFEDYMYRYNDDEGAMNSSSGYLIAPESQKDPNGFYKEFIDLAREVYKYSPTVGNAFNKDNNLAYTFTPYGVHIIMISSIPFAGQDATKALTFKDDAEMLNYIKTTKMNNKGDTLYKLIKEKLKSERETNIYNAFTTAKVPEKMVDDKNIVTKETKLIKKIYETYLGGK